MYASLHPGILTSRAVSWSRRVLCVVCLLALGEVAAGSALVPRGAGGYELTSHEASLLKLTLHAWGEQWRWFGFPESISTAEPGLRVVETTAEVPGTGVPVRLVHSSRLVAAAEDEAVGGSRVQLAYELRAAQDVVITGVVLALEADPESCPMLAVHRPDGTTVSRASSAIDPPLTGVATGITYECGEHGQVRFGLSRPVQVSTQAAELRLELAGERLDASRPYALTLDLVTSHALAFFSRTEDASAAPERTGWFEYPVGREGPPVDLSFMNRDSQGEFVPAGSRGFVRVDGERLVFDDGTEGRFWGVNLTAAAALPDAPRAVELAERLVRLGVNAVRLHHLDSWYRPIVDYSHPSGTSRHLDAQSMRRLDRLVYELRQRGIYIVLDPWVQRRFLPGDGIPGTEALGEGSFHLHPYIFFDERMQSLHREFLRAFWLHRNEFTGLRYVDDPAVIFSALANEALLQRGRDHVQLEPYRSDFISQYRRWALRSGVVPVPGDGVIGRNWPRNHQRFYIEVMRRFYGGMATFMREELGFRSPLNASNWFLWHWEIVSQQGMDLMDAHHYFGGDRVGPGQGLGGSWLDHPPGEPGGPFGMLGAMRVAGKPLVITEVAQSPPKRYRGAYLPGLASVASLQGWSGVFAYAFSQSASPSDVLSEFELEADPLSLAGLVAGALIYRRADVPLARDGVLVVVDDDHLFDLHHGERRSEAFEHSEAFNRLLETRRVAVCFEYAEACGEAGSTSELPVARLADLRVASSVVSSDCGSLWRDWARGIGVIDTPRTQGVYGRLGAAGRLSTGDLEVEVDTPFATIVVSALDGRTLAETSDILVVAMGQAENTGMRANFRGDTLEVRGRAPVLVEPVVGELRIRTGAVSAEIAPLQAGGRPGETLGFELEEGTVQLQLSKLGRTLMWRIRLVHADALP